MENKISIQSLIEENLELKEKILILERENLELKTKLSDNYEYNKKYYQEHREEILLYHKEYQKTEKYKEYQKEYKKKYTKENPTAPELRAKYNRISYLRRKEKKEQEQKLKEKNIENEFKEK